jgi:hypothetical protein
MVAIPVIGNGHVEVLLGGKSGARTGVQGGGAGTLGYYINVVIHEVAAIGIGIGSGDGGEGGDDDLAEHGQ